MNCELASWPVSCEKVIPVIPVPLPVNPPAAFTLPLPFTVNLAAPLFCPTRMLPPAALLKTPAVPDVLLT